MATGYDVYHQIPKERFEVLVSDYLKWNKGLTDMDREPIQVFAPMSQKMLDELELIREVSRELQFKRDEDIKNAAQAAEIQETEKAEDEKEAEDGEKTEEQETQKTEKTE